MAYPSALCAFGFRSADLPARRVRLSLERPGDRSSMCYAASYSQMSPSPTHVRDSSWPLPIHIEHKWSQQSNVAETEWVFNFCFAYMHKQSSPLSNQDRALEVNRVKADQCGVSPHRPYMYIDTHTLTSKSYLCVIIKIPWNTFQSTWNDQIHIFSY